MAAGQPCIGEQVPVPGGELRVHLRMRSLDHGDPVPQPHQDFLDHGGGHLVEGLVDAPVDQEHTGPWICCGDGCVLTLDVLTQFVGDHLHAQFVPQDTGTGDHGRGLR